MSTRWGGEGGKGRESERQSRTDGRRRRRRGPGLGGQAEAPGEGGGGPGAEDRRPARGNNRSRAGGGKAAGGRAGGRADGPTWRRHRHRHRHATPPIPRRTGGPALGGAVADRGARPAPETEGAWWGRLGTPPHPRNPRTQTSRDDVAGKSRAGEREREKRDAPGDHRDGRRYAGRGGGRGSRGGRPCRRRPRGEGAAGGGRAGVARGGQEPPCQPDPFRAAPPSSLSSPPRRATDPTGRPGRQRPPNPRTQRNARAPGANSRSPPSTPQSILFPSRAARVERLVRERAGRPPRSRNHVNDPSAGSPTETLLRLLLPLDSQVRPSSQRSARAVGRPRRGRSEGLTKPSNR